MTGGGDINPKDLAFAASLYPKERAPGRVTAAAALDALLRAFATGDD